jgi:pyruvate kinase
MKETLNARLCFPAYRHTKIVATLGPASADRNTLRRMMLAGMDIIRLNLSHGSFEDHEQLVKTIREISKEIGKHITILADIPGQKLRITYLTEEHLQVNVGETIRLAIPAMKVLPSTHDTPPAQTIEIGPPDYLADVLQKDIILLKDGAVILSVLSADDSGIYAVVTQGGILTPGSGVIFPDKKRTSPFVNAHFSKACLFAASLKPDYLALSFVESGEDLIAAKELLLSNNYEIPLIAKVESSTAVQNADDIMTHADGIMIARGDLGVAMPLEQIPHIH